MPTVHLELTPERAEAILQDEVAKIYVNGIRTNFQLEMIKEYCRRRSMTLEAALEILRSKGIGIHVPLHVFSQ